MDALCRRMVFYCGNLWSKDEIRFRLSLQEHCSKSPTEPRLSWKRKYHNAYILETITVEQVLIGMEQILFGTISILKSQMNTCIFLCWFYCH